MEEHIKQLESLILDRESFIFGDDEHDEIILKDIETLNFVIREMKRLNEYYQYCRVQEEKIIKLQKENGCLKYSLDRLKGCMVLEEREKIFIEKWRETIENTDEPKKVFVAIADERYFKPFDYISVSTIKQKIEYYESRGYIEIAGAFEKILEELEGE